MKTITTIFISILLIANLTACSNLDITALKTPVYPESISYDDYSGLESIREKNPMDDQFLNALTDFSYNLASKTLSSKSENICVSPTSLYMILSLAATGANGPTQNEIVEALGMIGKEKDYLSEQNGNLFRRLYFDNNIGKLKIANSLWLQKDIKFKDTFINNAAQNFYGSLFNIDFSDNKSGELVSKWISENTGGILEPRLNLNKEQILSMINTIYFKDEWRDRFDEDYTKPDTFYLKDGSEVKCDFMNSTYLTHSYVKGDGFTSSFLNLKNSGHMTFILPDEGVSIDDLIATPQKVALLFDMENREIGKVIFQIPKFSFGNDIDLRETMKSMGVSTAFERNADFTDITDEPAFISDIRQQTHIAIDENGIEATAYTQIVYAGSAPPKDKVAEMILDRPFIFAISSSNGAVLFIGVVNNPSDLQ